jgi:hypothetical protein
VQEECIFFSPCRITFQILHKYRHVRLEVLTTVKMLMLVFWVATPCVLAAKYQRFGETYCLHLQPWRWRQYVSPKRWCSTYKSTNIDTVISSFHTACTAAVLEKLPHKHGATFNSTKYQDTWRSYETVKAFEGNYIGSVISEPTFQKSSVCYTTGTLFLHSISFSAYFESLLMVKTEVFFMSLSLLCLHLQFI